MEPLVSILIPAHNAASWIAETIESALAQMWHRKEIILVDDGSTDRTLAIAQGYRSGIVKVVSEENEGASAARNKAFSLSQGDYIQWLDADDLLAPDKIVTQMRAVEKFQHKRIAFSSAWGEFMYRTSRAKFYRTDLWSDLAPVEWLLRKIGQNLHMQTSTWLVSRELTDLAGPWDVRLSLDDDGEYFSRLLLHSQGIRFVSEAKVFYRKLGSGSLSHVDYSGKKLDSQCRSTELHIEYIRSLEDSDRVRAACLKYLQRRAAVYHPERPDLCARLKTLAVSLGGNIDIPRPRKHYTWSERILGYGLAKRLKFFRRLQRRRLTANLDRVLFYWEACKPVGK